MSEVSQSKSPKTEKGGHRFGFLVPLLPVVLVVLVDFSLRGHRLVSLPPKYVGSYAAAMFESGVLWASLVTVASLRRGWDRHVAAALWVLLFTVSVGGQLYFYRQYSTYLNLDATLFGTSFAGSVFGQLEADGKNFLSNVLPPLVAALAITFFGRRWFTPGRVSKWTARVVAPVATVGVFLIPVSYRRVQASTPDVIYFHALGGLAEQLSGVRTTAQIRPGLRSPPPIGELTARPPVPRNVILLLTESVRYDCHCSSFRAECPIAPEVNAAVPGRIGFESFRSNATTTAIQLAVLWSGLAPTETRERLHGVPLLFDYAHAAGWGNAYWTSHHMMFANSRLWVQDLPTDFQCGGSDVEPDADIDTGGDDGLLVDRALRELPALKTPYFATVHVGNTHVPYKVDEAHVPFQPSASSKGEDDSESYFNFYRNAVFLQDRHVGRFLRELRAMPAGEKTIVIFTSDHGEGFREHGQLGHTGSLYEEELHVPAWVDAPPGTLTPAEEQNLRAYSALPTFSSDVTPTILDLMGVLEDPAMDSFRKGMVGRSLIRAPQESGPLAMTNCSGVWGCAFRNWGAMSGTLKVHAREWDDKWLCFDVARDPEEKTAIESEACSALMSFAEAENGGFPGAKETESP